MNKTSSDVSGRGDFDQGSEIVRWTESQAVYDALRRHAVRMARWMVLRTAVVSGLAVWGFCAIAARYAADLSAKWVAVIAGGYFGLWALDLLFQASRKRGPREYRLTTRGIVRWSGRRGLLRWERCRGFWVEFEEETGVGCRMIVLLRKGSRELRVPLPGDERDSVILEEARKQIREVPRRAGWLG